MSVVDIAIVGAGSAGLAAAYELQRQGVSFLLLEATQRLGGLIRTELTDGCVLDAGPDSLLVQKPAGVELCEELGLRKQLISTLEPRTAYVLHDRLIPIPEASILGIPTAISPWLTSPLLSPLGKLRMVSELFVPRGDATQESVGAFFKRRFGPETVERIADPLLAGIYAGDVDLLSVRSLFPKLVKAELAHRSVIRSLRAARTGEGHPTGGAFRSLADGMEQLVTTLVERLPEFAIRRDTPVVDLRGPSPYLLQAPEARTVSARAVILASPAHATARFVTNLDTRLSELCAAIPYRSTATVLLGYQASAVRRPMSGSGFVVSRSRRDVPLIAGSWVTSKWPGRAPTGYVLLRGFLGGTHDVDALSRSDDELIEQAHATFAKLLQIEHRPDLTRVYRWQQANPQHNVGHTERISAIEKRLTEFPGLFVTGAGYRGVGIPDCVADGRATARAAAEWHRNQ